MIYLVPSLFHCQHQFPEKLVKSISQNLIQNGDYDKKFKEIFSKKGSLFQFQEKSFLPTFLEI